MHNILNSKNIKTEKHSEIDDGHKKSYLLIKDFKTKLIFKIFLNEFGCPDVCSMVYLYPLGAPKFYLGTISFVYDNQSKKLQLDSVTIEEELIQSFNLIFSYDDVCHEALQLLNSINSSYGEKVKLWQIQRKKAVIMSDLKDIDNQEKQIIKKMKQNNKQGKQVIKKIK